MSQFALKMQACLLCGSRELELADQLTGKEIIALWEAGPRNLSARALWPITDTTLVGLWQCQSCGFRFYDPGLAGSAQFYEELMAGGYYAGDRPEFQFTVKFARRNAVKRILDIGCGDGAFLDSAKRNGFETYGVELNPAGAARAAGKGHKIISKPVEGILPADMGEPPDVVTAFQVVEHVPDPVGFVTAAARLARAGGWIIISVPNEFRAFGLCPYDPGNWPPHHITRWRFEDFDRLASRIGLKIVARGSDYLDGATIQDFILTHNLLAPAIRRKRYPISDGWTRALMWLYRKSGCKYFAPRRGRSIYVVMQKQGSSDGL